ncbi:hypothetical protein HPP92_021029 [Vanilla planifolia]|uniref:Uncharacterized protein n=1 Tax=Vanilla planifolia TaxID=51239 RepID=A0A835Q0T0_VANPL|nr:hypothetical protein HPP92_021029 [Vanilla planifolia]
MSTNVYFFPPCRPRLTTSSQIHVLVVLVKGEVSTAADKVSEGSSCYKSKEYREICFSDATKRKEEEEQAECSKEVQNLEESIWK